jgi:hypothetical protein
MMLSLARQEIARLQEQMRQDAVTLQVEDNIVCEALKAKNGLEKQLQEAKARHEEFVKQCTANFDTQQQIFVQARGKRNTARMAIEAAESAIKKLQEEINGMLPPPVPKQDKHIKKEVEQASVPPKEIVLPQGIVYRTSFIPPAFLDQVPQTLVLEAWTSIEHELDVHVDTKWPMLRYLVKQNCDNAVVKTIVEHAEDRAPDERLADFEMKLMAILKAKATRTFQQSKDAKAAAKKAKEDKDKAAKKALAAKAGSKRPLLDPCNGAAAQPPPTKKQARAQQAPEQKPIEQPKKWPDTDEADEADVFDSEELTEDEESDDEGRNLLCWDRFDGKQGSWRQCVVEKFKEWVSDEFSDLAYYPFLDLAQLSDKARAKLEKCTLGKFSVVQINYEQEKGGLCRGDSAPKDMEQWSEYFLEFFDDDKPLSQEY